MIGTESTERESARVSRYEPEGGLCLRSRMQTFVAAVVSLMLAAVATPPVRGAAPDPDPALRVQVSPATGKARFMTTTDAAGLAAATAAGARAARPIDVLRQYAAQFGITDVDAQLEPQGESTDIHGFTHTTFQQVHEGVPVFAALLRVHADPTGRVTAINGTFVPDVQISTTPTLDAARAEAIAVATVAKQQRDTVGLGATATTLYVFRRNLARGVPGANHLAYEVEVSGLAVREFVYVDAHSGIVIDQISGIDESINRRVYEYYWHADYLVWSEGNPLPYLDPINPTATNDINNFIEYAEDAYNLFASATNGAFLSWDGADGVMHHVYDAVGASCPNAFWNGAFTGFCPGVAGDDTVAHEWSHAYTQSTHNLIYQWQPGALNEAYSDIFGEVVDQLNSSGLDLPNDVRLPDACSLVGGLPPVEFQINAPPSLAGSYAVSRAQFNPAAPFSVTAEVEAADDGDDESGEGSTTDACQPLVGFTAGRIALIDRGRCEFIVKALHAYAAGATGMVVVTGEGQPIVGMPGYEPGQ